MTTRPLRRWYIARAYRSERLVQCNAQGEARNGERVTKSSLRCILAASLSDAVAIYAGKVAEPEFVETRGRKQADDPVITWRVGLHQSTVVGYEEMDGDERKAWRLRVKEVT